MFVCLFVCLDDRISLQSDSSQASLTINHTESTDTGCYLVQLVNIHGTDRMYSSVTVEGTSCPSFYTHFLPRDAMHKSGLRRGGVCG